MRRLPAVSAARRAQFAADNRADPRTWQERVLANAGNDAALATALSCPVCGALPSGGHRLVAGANGLRDCPNNVADPITNNDVATFAPRAK